MITHRSLTQSTDLQADLMAASTSVPLTGPGGLQGRQMGSTCECFFRTARPDAESLGENFKELHWEQESRWNTGVNCD